ncbi:hypothetical protein TBLA_0B02390 [Henningerozyma blattae CBS 6284]|uniref:histone deacetylase n=1 Tax=Henningerozyma blattae (strain ATCC 34711 / CBS 6284 / DSM 70876 / NBRC 10599 / NRRL Y-10934 / UCD 77-7) TaxID=1071380 RepID=I2GY79_HENB6|nr:hypothetical protein TBLA_0B02390 [Tetrapisispora blattae CBS 6284]CCH59081.1 hypothetical protein TBLA_0B02390 [Tetrapisispora blattae CBS 6284]
MTKLIISSSKFQSAIVDLLPCNNGSKSRLTHSLIDTYGLLQYFDHVVMTPFASKDELLNFHTIEYLNVILDEKLNKRKVEDETYIDNWNYLNQVGIEWLEENKPNESKSFELQANFQDDNDNTIQSTNEIDQYFNSIETLYKYYSYIAKGHKATVKNYNTTSNKKRTSWEALLDELSDDSMENSTDSANDNSSNNSSDTSSEDSNDDSGVDLNDNSSDRLSSKNATQKHEIDSYKATVINDIVDFDVVKLKQYNLVGDCPIFSFLPMYCHVLGGSTLRLLDHIDFNEKQICINWDGGRHHSRKKKASGFCYVNDIVLCIQKLGEKGFRKITYLDFDLHHGDGVEKSFQYSKHIQTISVHLFEPGFFPCTGSLEETKHGFNIVNIPTLHGLDDNYLTYLLNRVIIPLIKKHKPECLVVQCGGDGLIGDRYKEWQMTISGLTKNIMLVLQNFPECSVVLLGGGGYNERVMSRFHTFLTWKVVQTFSSKGSTLLDQFESDYHEEHSTKQNNDTTTMDSANTQSPFSNNMSDILIPEHEFSDFYGEELCRFWAYELPASQYFKQLHNDNIPNYIDKLVKFYNL